MPELATTPIPDHPPLLDHQKGVPGLAISYLDIRYFLVMTVRRFGLLTLLGGILLRFQRLFCEAILRRRDTKSAYHFCSYTYCFGARPLKLGFCRRRHAFGCSVDHGDVDRFRFADVELLLLLD